ncbi:MAG: class I SAM-dependent methyltransferase [Candidatus Paceibacterota bacterium]|jgi:predicted O-methyltransferase YrrM
MSITQELLWKANGLINANEEVSDPTKRYTMADSGGVELEVGEFLYGLVRVLKPNRVLTTGIYSGISDMYIARAMKDNGFGHSYAVEYEPQHIARAKKLWDAVGVSDVIDTFLMDSRNFVPEGKYELMFLDTEPQLRFGELERFLPYLVEGGFVGIHDLPRTFCQGNTVEGMEHWPFGKFPETLKENITEWLTLSKFHLPNPRGCVFFYKRHQEDYP